MTNTTDIARTLGVSPASRMVNGYSGRHRNVDQMDDAWNWRVLHPEMKRRELALFFSDPRTVRAGFDAAGSAILVTPLGNGSSGRGAGLAAVRNFWSRNSRTYLSGRPSRSTPEGRAWLKPGYAPIAYPGGSNHEDDTWQGSAMATDAVGWQDGWMGRNVKRFGLRTFWNVGSEPWHLQFDGYGASKKYLQADLRIHGYVIVPLPAVPLAANNRPPAPPQPPALPAQLSMEDDDMNYLAEHRRIIDTRTNGGPIAPGKVRKIPLGMLNIALINVTAIGPQGGFVSVGGSPAASPGTSSVNYDADGISNTLVAGAFPDGHAYVRANVHPCNVIVDLQAFGAAS